MQGRALTPDVILSGNLSVSKTVNLQNKVIYNNGQYEADDGYDGLGKVTVDVHNEMTDLKATENGVYLPPEGYDGFDSVHVDVPDPELDAINITQNGRYTPPTGVYGYDDIYVNVNLNLESKTITANGHYEPSQGRNGFSDVTVNVPERVPVIESKSITENGTYTAPSGVDGYSPITVNVPVPAGSVKLKELTGLPASIASFNDAAALPINELTCSIVPVQSGSGDPSPTNVRPISGWTEEVIKNTGANLIGGDLFANAVKNAMPSATIDETEKTVSFTSSATLDNYIVVNDRTYGDYYIPFKENTSYTFVLVGYNSKTTATATNLRIYYTDGTNTTLNFGSQSATKQTIIYTTPASKTVNRLSKTNQDGTTVLYYDECGIFEGAITAQDYEPYAGTTTTIQFTDSQGQSVEVFGGSVDVVNGGEQPRTKVKIDLYTLDWTYQSNNSRFYVASPSDLLRPSENAQAFNGLCSAYLVSPYAEHGDKAIAVTTTGSMFIFDADYTDATALKTFLQNNNVQLVYELATPTTFYTQPTSIKSLDGVNNVFASTGDVTECEYFTPVQ